jgi:hypothetical protein
VKREKAARPAPVAATSPEPTLIQAIARRLRTRNAVKKALASDEQLRYRRAAKGSIVDAVEPQIRALLAEFPDMPSTVLMERVGWTCGKTVFCDRVQQLRPLFCRIPRWHLAQPATRPAGGGVRTALGVLIASAVQEAGTAATIAWLRPAQLLAEAVTAHGPTDGQLQCHVTGSPPPGQAYRPSRSESAAKMTTPS